MAASTYTENGQVVLDQKIILGEQYLPTYSTGFDQVPSTATATAHLLQLMAGASLNVRVRRIMVYQQVAATTATIHPLGVVRLSSAGTGGAVPAISPFNPADAAAGASAMTLPTVKGAEGVRIDSAVVYLVQTVSASAQINQPILTWDYTSSPLIIPAGVNNGIAIKNFAAAAGANVCVVIYFTETSF